MLYIIYGTAGDSDDREDIKGKGPHCRPLHPARIFGEDILIKRLCLVTSFMRQRKSPSVTFNYEATGASLIACEACSSSTPSI